MNWVSFIIIGVLVGWIAGLLIKGRGQGLIGNLVVGVIGAIVGGYLYDFLNITAGGEFGSFIMAVIGAVVVLYLIKIIKGR